MTCLLSLLAAAALMALQHSLVDSLPSSSFELDNSLDPNFSALPPPRRARPRTVSISRAPPPAVHYVPGAGLTVDCEVLGSPAPAVQWLRNGEPISDSEEDANELIPVDESSVARAISRLSVEAEDGDVLTCVGRAGPARAAAATTVSRAEVDDEANLLMLQKLKRYSSRPLIAFAYSDLLQEMGTTVVLPCRVRSSHPAQVYWRDNEGNVVFGGERMKILTSGDLLISNVQWSDMGEYVCTAKNVHGKDSVTTFLYPLRRKGH